MAYTVSKELTVLGNKRVVSLDITADAATQTIETGLSVIDFFTVGAQSLSTAGIKIYPNVGATGTSIAGSLGLSGLVSGDELFIVCYGK